MVKVSAADQHWMPKKVILKKVFDYKMSTPPPQSYLAIDPGKQMGVAYYTHGMDQPKWETWKFKHKDAGSNYLNYLTRLNDVLSGLPDCQIGIELMTVVAHNGAVNAKQVQVSSGWFNVLDIIRAKRGMRAIEQVPIQSWRAKTHGKVFAPKEMKKAPERRLFLKKAAIDYCHDNDLMVENNDTAEAVCILEWLRIEFEPDFAFEAGHAHHQIGMDV